MDRRSEHLASDTGSSESDKKRKQSGIRRPPPPLSPPPAPPPAPPDKSNEPQDVAEDAIDAGKEESVVPDEEQPTQNQTTHSESEEIAQVQLTPASLIEEHGGSLTDEHAQEQSTTSPQPVNELSEDSVNASQSDDTMLSKAKPNKLARFMSELNSAVRKSQGLSIDDANKTPPLPQNSSSSVKPALTDKSESESTDTAAHRGRKPQPIAKPRNKPPPPPRKPPKAVLSNSSGNSPDTSLANPSRNVLNRSHSPHLVNSRSPSPRPPISKKPGLPAKPPTLKSKQLVKSESSEKEERSDVARDKPVARKSLKRISPMNVSFTTEDLDLLHKPAEETTKETTDIKRQESGDTSQQRAVKKDKRRSKSVGASAFIDLLEQMQAKSAANGSVKVPPSFRRSQTTDGSTIEEKQEPNDPGTPSSGSHKNLQQAPKGSENPEAGSHDSIGKTRPNSQLKKQNSLIVIDKPGNTPPAIVKTMIVMDIDIDNAETPKRPSNPSSSNARTTRPKPDIPSKPKGLPPKPKLKKSMMGQSSPNDKTACDVSAKDSKSADKAGETSNTNICDKENVLMYNAASGNITVTRNNSEKKNSADFGSEEKLQDPRVKKKKKSFSERFSFRRSAGGSVFYNDTEDIGTKSKFYVSDSLNNDDNAVNSDSLHNAECNVKVNTNQDVKKLTDIAAKEEGESTKVQDCRKEEKVHELVRFGSTEKEPSSSKQKDGKMTPELHYYESVADQPSEADGGNETSGPRVHLQPADVSHDIGGFNSEDLQDALDRTISVSDDNEMKPTVQRETHNEDDSKIYDNNFIAANERRSARSKRASESKSEIGPQESDKPRYENMEALDNNVDEHSDSEFDSFSDDEESDEADGGNQLSQAVLEKTVVDPKNKVKNIAMELFTTERDYVTKLKLVDQTFQNRIIVENRAHHMFPDNVIPQMFSNVKSIYQFHNDFLLVQLENRMQQWDEMPKIGDLMKKFAPFLKLYTDYVQNYDSARSMINLWMQKSPKFASLIEEIQKSPECGLLTLQHHMLGPVQRVPRYEMLLKQYISHLPEDSNDKEDSEVALQIVSTAASHSNEAMAKLDKFRRLWAVNESVGGAIDLMNPTLELIKEGRVIKISQRNAYQSERYLFLFSEILLVCRTLPVAIGAVQYKVKDELSLDGMHVLEGDNLITPNTFYVKSKEKSMEFHFASHEEKMEWHVTILNAVGEHARKLSARQPAKDIAEMFQDTALGLRAPTWIKDQETSMCMLCSSAFTTITRRRHHCRACGIVICGKCSSHSVKLPYDDNKLNRVCNKCYDILSGRKITLAKSDSSGNTRTKGILQVKAIDKSLICGYMQMSHDKKSWQKRWFAAHENFVLYSFKAHQDVIALTSMPLPGYQTQDDKDDNDKDIIKLFHKCQKTYYFQADDNATLNRWKTVLSALTKAEIPDSVA